MTYAQALEKAAALVGKMTVEETASQLLYNAPAIERLGISEYNWWNEALHGVARAGTATVFPQSIGMAATFDPKLLSEVADAISTEGRAKYNQSIRFGDRGIYKGLTYWSPNINIFRDPRWGRGQETFGEDPFLTATMGCSFIKGIQGDGEFLKATACAKHYAVHSGPEGIRHSFNAVVSKKDLFETYLPAFEWAVKSAGVRGIMGAYNRTNGQPCCAHTELMRDILFDKWNFKGYFVSDCGAIYDIHENHKYTVSHTASAALALKSGCDLNCGNVYSHLIDAYEEDLVTEDELRAAATRLFAIRYLLGEFENVRPYSDIPFSRLDCAEFTELNRKTARESVVLLKNVDGFLPISPKKVSSIAAIGPNVNSRFALEGNYNGRASKYITVADGLASVFPNSQIHVAEGSLLVRDWGGDGEGLGHMCSSALAAAANSDVTVLCLGLDASLEGEEGSSASLEGYYDKGDKLSIMLPPTQCRLAEAICEVTDELIVIIMAGSELTLPEKVRARAKAILYAWYPGAQGGLAIAELIAGMYSPSARLPLTFYRPEHALPDFTDYAMTGRTYRFIDTEPLYPFGYGLSYTSFAYSNVSAVREGKNVRVKAVVTNIGGMAGSEPVQVYAKFADSRTKVPNFQLCGIEKIYLEPSQSKTVELLIDGYWLKAVSEDGERIAPDGGTVIYVGGHQPDALSVSLCGECCEIEA